jgi:cob(I)alamin adenosyltransferase
MFKKHVQAPAVPLTHEQLAVKHRQLAEAHLARASKAGRLEAQAVHAERATAHATLSLAYLATLSYERSVLPDVEVTEEDIAAEEAT